MQERIDKDLKTAMLAGDKRLAEVLRGLKNALQYQAVAQNSVDRRLSEEQISQVLAREAKKRREAADIYAEAGESQRAQTELAEKTIIEKYLPKQMDETAVLGLVKAEIAAAPAPTMADMGKIIGAVKTKAGPAADGATIARLVKENLS